jgi:hypothetical protein
MVAILLGAYLARDVVNASISDPRAPGLPGGSRCIQSIGSHEKTQAEDDISP